jgi:two-component sensor histidine kinase
MIESKMTAAPRSETINLLYIDDDLAFGRLVQKRLERAGYAVMTVATGDEGLATMAKVPVDAVALDHYMPDRDGLATLALIRALPDPPPVIYVTATNEGRVAVAALKAGAADYVVKDVQDDFVELLDVAVRAAMASTKLRRERDMADTEMREARHRFEALAAERQLLMREVNHRVGNSLQLVAAFLHMQSATADPEIRAELNEANRRVLAIAQVHRRLYASDDVKTVALAQYLTGLVEDIRASADGEGLDGPLSLRADDVDVDPDSAVTIGIIVTELVINAIKYAYPGGTGPIRVSMQQNGGDALRLTVEDDGTGETGVGASSRTGIGKIIINSMASKLNAQVDYEFGDSGTRAVVSFATPKPERASENIVRL